MAPDRDPGTRAAVRGVLDRLARRPEWLESLATPLETLPEDLVERSGLQIRKAALAFSAIWVFELLIAYPLSALFTGAPHAQGAFPHPGTELALLGLLSSIVMAILASRRGADSRRLMVLALVHEVFTAGLVSTMSWWAPGRAFRTGLSPICLFLPLYPALAPLPLGATLSAGLFAATMDVVGWAAAHARGVGPEAHGLKLIWGFGTTYLCAILSVLPATIIRRLSRDIQQARDMGAYRLGKLIGKGGMGEVYQASHRLLARPAAVKVIPAADLAGMTGEARTRALERFRREAAVAAALTSTHTIEMFDFGITDQGTYYYVMELLQGMDLQTMVDRHGPLSPARAIHFLRQTAESLAEAHQFGIVHRDIKPSNIFAARLGLEVDFVKVLDFGVVKLDARPDPDEQLQLSRAEIPIGTPAYMAPEGIDGGATLTPPADVYSLGCVAFFLLTGEMVFTASSVLRMAMMHMEQPPRAPSTVQPASGIPPELDALVLSCLAKNPAHRPQDGIAVLSRLIPLAAALPWTQAAAREWWDAHPPVVPAPGP